MSDHAKFENQKNKLLADNEALTNIVMALRCSCATPLFTSQALSYNT